MVKNIDMLSVSDEDVNALFNNIEESRDFNEYVVVCVHMCVFCLSVCLHSVCTYMHVCICTVCTLVYIHYICDWICKNRP